MSKKKSASSSSSSSSWPIEKCKIRKLPNSFPYLPPWTPPTHFWCSTEVPAVSVAVSYWKITPSPVSLLMPILQKWKEWSIVRLVPKIPNLRRSCTEKVHKNYRWMFCFCFWCDFSKLQVTCCSNLNGFNLLVKFSCNFASGCFLLPQKRNFFVDQMIPIFLTHILI